MAQVDFLERFRVGVRIKSGFAIVLGLLITLALVAVIHLRSGADGLKDYARVSVNTIKVLSLTAEVAEMRRRVVLFAQSGDEQPLIQARELIGLIGTELEALIADTKNAERGQMLLELQNTIHRYGDTLEQAVPLRAEREAMFSQTMAASADKLSASIAAVTSQAMAAGDYPLAARAGIAENAFTKARYWAARYTAKDEPRFAEFAASQVTLFGKAITELRPQVSNAQLLRQLDSALTAAGEYQQRFHESQALNRRFDELVYQTLAGIGVEFADKAATLREAQLKRNSELMATSNQNMSRAVSLTIGLSLAALLVGLLCASKISASIIRPVEGVRQVMHDLAEGHLDVTVPYTTGQDELAEMARAVQTFKDLSTSAVRAGCALDRVTANVMMADTSGRITYVNPALTQMFKLAESDLRQVMTNFNAEQLVGRNYDEFHHRPEHQRQLLASLTTPHQGQAKVGRRIFWVIANPVIGRLGERLGTVVEWRDLTDEIMIEDEIKDILEGALHGDLSRRVALEDKTGFFRAISEGINNIAATVSDVSEEVATALDALAGGDLSQRITKTYEGVFGRLKNDYNTTADKLGEVVGRITDATKAISSAAAEISTSSVDLSERTEQQASNLEETTAAMEQLGASTRRNADNAIQANQQATQAKQAAEHGGKLAESAVDSIKRIEQASRKITEIIGVIDEIAFQTNLLALNAAVEAARAGDAGKGFAVVAQEVRVLAQRSAQASKEIKTLITASDSQVRDGVEMVQKAGGALGGIVDSVNRVARMIEAMATSSSEQASAIGEINSAVAWLDETTQKNAALVEESAAAAQSMAGQSRDLQDLMAFFIA